MKAITLDRNEATEFMNAVNYAAVVLQQRIEQFATSGVECDHMVDAIGQLHRIAAIFSTYWAHGELAIVGPHELHPTLEIAA